MTTDIFGAPTQTTEEVRTERANRAVRAFKAMQPGLNGYARAITGRKDIEVVIDKGVTRTDGKKIYFRPPIELGDLNPHDRLLCDRRNPEDLKQLCPACRIRETVLIQIYHEIAHNLHGTFEEVSDHAKASIYDRALEASGTKYAAKLKRAWDRIPDYKKHDYINLSSLVSPFLPVLVNAIEDARVDESMFKARKGTRVMFSALTEGIFRDGITGDDGEVFRWSERPLNSQILIGVFVLACGYKYEGWFAPEVEEAMGDEYLRSLVARVDSLRSAEGSYGLAFPILERLRELGFCKTDEDPNEDPEEENEDDDSNKSEDGEGEGESESSDSASDGEGEPEDPESGDEKGSGEASDSDEPEEGGDAGEDASGDESGDAEDGSGADGESDGDADSGSGEDGDVDGDRDREGAGDGGEDSSDHEGASSDAEGEVDPRESSSDDGDGGGSDGGEGSSAEGGSGDPTEDGEQGSERSSGEDEGSDSNSHSDDGGDAGDVQESPLDRLIDDEPVDTGADDGDGGKKGGSLDYGTPEQAEYDLKVFSNHEEDEPDETPAGQADSNAVERAVIQGEYFEKPSTNITGVRLHKFGQPLYAKGYNISHGWADLDEDDDDPFSRRLRRRRGADVDLDIPESVLGPATTEMRRALSDNARAKQERHLRSGKINQRVLGKRAWAGDDRLFQKKRIPGKRSYAVILGIDISGSTWGLNLSLAKRAAMAQAQLCQRVGVDFAIYAHTAGPDYEKGTGYDRGLYLDVYEVKSFDAPWDTTSKEALSRLTSAEENIDGHTIEFYRKQIERHPATDKIILYYTDGKMPAANHDEELEILQREILTCKKQNITLLGVGIRTDSPRRHGLETVEVESDSDVSKVVRHLQNGLLHNR